MEEESSYAFYIFKPDDRSMDTAKYVWRAVLDNVGLTDMELPEITPTLVDWGVFLNIADIKGKEGEIEEQLNKYVEEKYLRYAFRYD